MYCSLLLNIVTYSIQRYRPNCHQNLNNSAFNTMESYHCVSLCYAMLCNDVSGTPAVISVTSYKLLMWLCS